MDILTAQEAAKILRLNVKRIQSLARAGRLPGRRVGRKWLFRQQDLDRLLDTSAPTSPSAFEMLSARNHLRGRVSGLRVDGLMAEVRVRFGDQELVSMITRNSAERLRLRVGDEVYAVIKSTEVMIGKGNLG